MRIKLIITSILLAAITGQAQPALEWSASVALSESDRLYSMVESPDGGFLAVGQTFNEDNKSSDMLLVRTDIRGNVIWTKKIGYAGKEAGHKIVVDGNTFLIAGYTTSAGAGASDMWLVRIDAIGEVLMEKTFGGKFDDEASCLVVNEDGSIVLGGYTMVQASSTIHGYVLKADNSGNKLWEKEIDGHFRTYINAIVKTKTDYVIGGYFRPMNTDTYTSHMGRMVSLDDNGKILWDQVYGGEKDDAIQDIVVFDGKLLALGTTESMGGGQGDRWLLQTDMAGKRLWDFGAGQVLNDEGNSMAVGSDGMVVSGTSNRRETNSDDIVLNGYASFNLTGNTKMIAANWEMISGGELNEHVSQLITTADGGFALTGYTCTPYNYDSKPVRCSALIYKYQGSPEKAVEYYVNRKVNSWRKRGEFERSEDYEARIAPAQMQQVMDKHKREAIDYYAARFLSLENASLSKYDADKELFMMNVSGGGVLQVQAPIDVAQSFKDNFGMRELHDLSFDLRDGKFTLKSATMKVGRYIYTYKEIDGGYAFVKTGETAEEETLLRGGNPLEGLNIAKAAPIKSRTCYALVIGIDNYKGHWKNLNNAVRDAQGVEKLLKERYGFQHMRTLFDEEATRENIINAMMWLVENVKEEDNVLIYYSGHGEYNKALDKGYWVPVDAQTASVSAYISNS
ncbi:MAG: caspase family protein, partial [Flavobacteriales bacterium]|nr:caspase family protein [Flavobacteriales bacterium]